MPESEHQWLDDYFNRYRKAIFNKEIYEALVKMKTLFKKVAANDRKIIFAGNGGSASIANHCAIDFSKNTRIRSQSFSESSLITCLANDCGYENWLSRAIELYGDSGDAAVLISSSGQSPNIINAANTCKKKKIHVVTLTGFDQNNTLCKLGDLNFWVDSRAYNIVENTHQIWLLTVGDMIIGKAEYSFK